MSDEGPRRTCIGCRQVTTPEHLVRVALGTDGCLLDDRRAPGRGAWLCAGSAPCFDRASDRQQFARALRSPVSTEALAALRARLFGAADQGNQRDQGNDHRQRIDDDQRDDEAGPHELVSATTE